MIKDTDYAYAVARIRANERLLLTSSDMESLISCPTLNAAYEYLSSKGWTVEVKGKISISEVCKIQNSRLWTLLCESVPDTEAIKILTVENDYFNLKAAIKSIFASADPSRLFAFPTSLDLDLLSKSCQTHEFDLLCEPVGETAEKAYKAACTTGSGQSADIIIDSAALTHLQHLAEKSKSELVRGIADFMCACADIKTAYRCAKTGKSLSFAEQAVAPCGLLDSKTLCEVCVKGEAELFEYLASTELKHGAELLKKSTTAFEKWCDDTVIEKAKQAKYMFFGFEPVFAFYYAKQAEIKCVRVILGGKESGISNDVIRERVRALYV